MYNEAFGWAWITLGFLTGAVLGLFFKGADFLGGYDAFPRRLVRLGHISLFGLGILNVLFAFSLPHVRLSAFESNTASACMIFGGVSMPLCCGLTAWRPSLRPTFVIPVAMLVIGGWTLAFALARQSLGGAP